LGYVNKIANLEKNLEKVTNRENFGWGYRGYTLAKLGDFLQRFELTRKGYVFGYCLLFWWFERNYSPSNMGF